MEITEKERLMLVQKKEKICGLSLKILDMVHDPHNSLEIKKNIMSILSELSAIASYSDSKNHDLNEIASFADHMFDSITNYAEEEKEGLPLVYWNEMVAREIELFCNYANSVRFDFTKKGFKIVLPKSLNLGIHFHEK